MHTQSYQEEADALKIGKQQAPGNDVPTELLFSDGSETWNLEHEHSIRPSPHSC